MKRWKLPLLPGLLVTVVAAGPEAAVTNTTAGPPVAEKKPATATDLPAGLPVLEAPRDWGDTFLPKSEPPAREVLAVPLAGLKSDERIALSCLQGLLAREQPRLWLVRHEEDSFWMEWHRARGHVVRLETVTNWPALFQQFRGAVKGAAYVDREQVWTGFLQWTRRLMEPLGQRTIRTVRGSDANVTRYADALPFCHSVLADMGRYSGRSGIANLTYPLPGGMPVFRSVTSWRHGKEGFLREVREQVGAQRPAFVNGFVHCWTFTMDDLARIHEQRDADMVFVTPSQLSALFRQAQTQDWTRSIASPMTES